MRPNRLRHQGIRAAALHAHNSATIEDCPEGARVTCPPDQWSYAAHVVLSDLLGDSIDVDVVVRLAIEVEEGSLGVGLIDSALQTYRGPELVVGKTESEWVELSVPPGAFALMTRNVDGSGTPTRFRIREFETLDLSDESARAEYYWGPGFETLQLPPTHGALSGHGEPGLGPPVRIAVVPPSGLGCALGLPIHLPDESSALLRDPLTWKMDPDDARVLSQIYRALQPRRHLEIGTWEGFGVVTCVDASPDVEITTINLPDGEVSSSGTPSYPGAGGPTDAGSSIGRLYRQAGLGSQVRQILADSTAWTPDVPEGHFDSVLVDGGHSTAVVASDSLLAARLVRPGGLVLWHDFCPLERVLRQSDASRGVVRAISEGLPRWGSEFDRMVWVRPSYVLIGRRAP